jgi:hypothetical protein
MKSPKEAKNELLRLEEQKATVAEAFRKLPLIEQVSSKGLALKEKYHKIQAKKQGILWTIRSKKLEKGDKGKKQTNKIKKNAKAN